MACIFVNITMQLYLVTLDVFVNNRAFVLATPLERRQNGTLPIVFQFH